MWNKMDFLLSRATNGTKSNFELRIKSLLRTPGALGTCPVDVGTPLFALEGCMLRL
jgi:hypothetical protein